MYIKELRVEEFNDFVKTHQLGSYYQTTSYALLMAENNFEYDLIGYVDQSDNIKAAALILIKKIGMYKYGYSPKGFLIDYFNFDLLKSFSSDIRRYYSRKLAFIKINPEIAIGEINKNNKLTNYNQNIIIRDYLKECGYKKLKDNLYFEALFPRYNAIINLDEYDFNSFNKNTRNKIRKAEKKGLVFEKVDREGLDILFNFVKNKKNRNEFYYKNYFNIFEKKEACDLFLVGIDYKKYLINSKNLYDKELEKNNILSRNLINDPSENNINKKMNSDKALLAYKNDIEFATHYLNNNEKIYIAGALTVKFNNRINIVISGIDTKFKMFNANYFLHYKIIEFYKETYKFIDLNGITGDFTDTNPYKGLNEFKVGFNPHLYEFIGEFDFIINEKAYYYLMQKGLLAKEFNHNKKKGN